MLRPTDHTSQTPVLQDVTVRLAGSGDSQALRRLATLDSASAPGGPVVVAELGGEIVAAMPVLGGPAIADPFRHTAALVEMLVLRARQLRLGMPAPETRSVGARLRGVVRAGRPTPYLP